MPAQCGAADQHIARAADLVLHQGDEIPASRARRAGPRGVTPNVRRSRARKIDAAFLEIDRDVLPEIRELQSAAHEIRKPLALGVAIAEKIQHQASHRIGRITRIAEQIIDGLEAAKFTSERNATADRRTARAGCRSAAVSASATNTGWRGVPA